MKRFRIAGLCLVAVFAFSAVAAASALAAVAEPTFMACTEVAKTNITYVKVQVTPKTAETKESEKRAEEEKEIYEGKYSNKECTEAAPATKYADTSTGSWRNGATTGIAESSYASGPEGKYELEEASATLVTGKSGTTTITAKGVEGNPQVVVCEKDAIAGETSGDEIVGTTFTFEKCEGNDSTTDKCGNVGIETIETHAGPSGLPNAVPYYINEALTEFGLEWALEDLDFTCGTEKVEVSGYLLGTAVNTPKGVTVTFSTSGGHQEDRTIWWEEGGGKESSSYLNNLFSRPGAWNTTEATVAGAEEIEMKGVSIRES